MFDVLFADLIVSGSGGLPTEVVVVAVAGGLLLGYSLVGALTRQREREEPAPADTGEPLYAVVLHNDDFNTFGFVIGVLGNVFGYGGPTGFWHAFKVHCTGRGIVWRGTLEAAQQRAEEVRSFGPDPNGRRGVQALVVSVEPLPA